MMNFLVIFTFFFFLSNEFIFFDSEKIIVIGFFLLLFSILNFSKEIMNDFFNTRREDLKSNFSSYYSALKKLVIIVRNLCVYHKGFLFLYRPLVWNYTLLIMNIPVFTKSRLYKNFFFKNLSLYYINKFSDNNLDFLKTFLNKHLFNKLFLTKVNSLEFSNFSSNNNSLKIF